MSRLIKEAYYYTDRVSKIDFTLVRKLSYLDFQKALRIWNTKGFLEDPAMRLWHRVKPIFESRSVYSAKNCFQTMIAALLLLPSAAGASKLSTLYNGLDPLSVSEHLTLYKLYPESEIGKHALDHAWKLLGGGKSKALEPELINDLVTLIAYGTPSACPTLGKEELSAINKLTEKLPHKKLKGHFATSEAEVIALPSEEVDLARGMLLSQLGKGQLDKIRSIEALLDLIALQIEARVREGTEEEKVDYLSRFIFEEIGFRFPPHSEYADAIDEYTFLSTVLDSRVGVCLGVSSLYLSLAQRLGVELEIITPPGHIFIRHGDHNIETTARGIRIRDEEYLGVNTRSLQKRSVKEVIALTHINQASVYWKKERYENAITSYLKAEPYMPKDLLLQELLGYNFILNGEEKKGRKRLKKVAGHTPDDLVFGHSVAEDFLARRADRDGIAAVFQSVDETRESLEKKRYDLQKVTKRTPKFRAAWFHLANVWLQLNREKEALSALERYRSLEKNDPTAEYYLAILYMQRLNLLKAWKHLERAKELTAAKSHHPLALKSLEHHLHRLSPRELK